MARDRAFRIAALVPFVLALSTLGALAAPGLLWTGSESPAGRSESPAGRSESPAAAWLGEHVGALAAPEMEGRGSGTPGGDRAARYLAAALAAHGLDPGGDGGTFFQSFTVARGTRLAPGNALTLESPAAVTLVAGTDFIPHGGAPDAEVSADLVFAAQDLDQPGLDVRGKVVIALPAVPEDLRGFSPRLDRLITARERGAAALLLVDESLPPLDSTSTRVDLPSATITRAAAARLLVAAGAGLRGEARALPGARVRLRIALASEDRQAANVIGVLPGTGESPAGRSASPAGRSASPAGRSESPEGRSESPEVIIVGAHYDHLGRLGDAVYAGADDNASGTAVVLGLARTLAARPRLSRTVVFALFSGEEMGLIGSGRYVDALGRGIGRVVAMLNFDMVGRLRDGRLQIGGVASGSGLRAAVEGAARAEGLDVVLHDSPFAPSDHARFYAAGVPVLFFHTGSHADYHRPSDTADRIDADGMARIARMAIHLVDRLAAHPRPEYVALRPPAQGPGGRAGAAFLGILGDGREPGDGVHVAGVVPGSAAARLGLAAGDVIVRFAGAPVNGFPQLLEAIGARQPGDRVDVVYLREGAPRAGSEALGARP